MRIFLSLLSPAVAFSDEVKSSSNLLSFITQNIRKSYECLAYTCHRGPVPEILKTAQLLCESQKKTLGCSQITQKEPDDAKYIRSCSFEKICERQLMPQLGINLVACLRGAADVYKSYDSYLERVAYRIEERNEQLSKCIDVSCKREKSKGVPEFDRMNNETLEKYPIAYIQTRVDSYRAFMAPLKRNEAERKYFSENTAAQRFEANQSRTEPTSSLQDIDYIDAGKRALKKSNIILDCYDPIAYAELLCYGVLKVLIPGLTAKGAVAGIRSASALFAKTAERRGVQSLEHHLFESERSLVRDIFAEKYFVRKFTTKEQNAAFIKAAEESTPIPGRLFFRFENGYLKELNTQLDKVTATSLNNKYDEILFRRFEALQKKYPKVEFPPYQGFKEGEFFTQVKNATDLPVDLKKEVGDLFEKTNRELKAYVTANNLLRGSDHPEMWYRAGVGRTGDMANYSARRSRRTPDKNLLTDYDDSTALALEHSELMEAKKISEELAKNFVNSEMVRSKNGILTINADVMGMVRKYDDPVELRQMLAAKYPSQTITAEHVDKLNTLYRTQDIYSPPVRFAEREMAHFTSSKGTQVGVDFVNAGGANAEAQLRALALSRNPTDMLTHARSQFTLVTAELDRMKAQFQKICEDLAEIHNKNLPVGAERMTVTWAKSGDDGVAGFSQKLTPQQKDWISKEWARREADNGKPGSTARISIPSEAVENEVQKNILAGHGESIEKALRTRVTLNQVVPNNVSGQLNVKVEMKGLTSGKGYVDMSITTSKGTSLTSDQILALKKQFEDTVKEINATAAKGEKLKYKVGDFKIIP
ncbi:MAG: hypothetical protein JNL11_03540 [Bdellovibrionaceae bacterium]|nr:hypothetical protein [Pseudobdellovibrionaceae bacterium]